MNVSESDRVLVNSENGIKRITINDPEALNAVSRSMAERFFELVQEAATDDSRVVVISGAGKAFCSGANVKKMRSHSGGFSDVTEFLQKITNPTIRALREMPKPVIARIPGVATGVGFNYALACDIRIASTKARFGQVFSRIGLVPDGGSSYVLPRMIGYAQAFELMVTGEVFGAEKALQLGLVNRVVDPEKLDETVDDIAGKLATGPALSYAGIKRNLAYGETHSLAETLDQEGVEQKICMESHDFVEGTTAFVEKRPARFEGR